MQIDLESKKRDLVEKLGVHLENKHSLAPVAARIWAFIILTGKPGTTFDQLVTALRASKSTISTHLSHLQDLNKIVYFTKPGDRKKYFIINRDQILLWIEEMIEKWNSEKQLHLEVMAYKNEYNSQDTTNASEIFELDFHEGYINFLDSASIMISDLRDRTKTNSY